MPKTVTLSIECRGVSAGAFCSVTYCSEEFLKGYHAAVNNDTEAIIPAFEQQDGSRWGRVVEFTVPFKAPSIIMKMIGSASQLRVLETQRMSTVTRNDGSIEEIHIESKPRPQLGSIGEGFTSDALVKIVDDSRGMGCSVVAVVEVSAASAPYGMVGIVENFMADTAKASLNDLLQHMCSAVENLKENGMLLEVMKRNMEDQSDVHAWLGITENVFVIREASSDLEDWTPVEYQSVYYSDTNEDVIEALQEMSRKVDAMQVTLDTLVSLQKERSLSLRFDASVWWYASSMLAGALLASYVITQRSERGRLGY